jgi:hypothetical protein
VRVPLHHGGRTPTAERLHGQEVHAGHHEPAAEGITVHVPRVAFNGAAYRTVSRAFGRGARSGVPPRCRGSNNRDAAHELALEASPIATPVRALADRAAWDGTATELLQELYRIADDAAKRAKGWPATAKAVGNALRRIAPNLWAVGVAVVFDREATTVGGS